MNNENSPCLKNACWCKDDALPPIGSLWEYKDPSLPYNEEGIYRICICNTHRMLFFKNTDTSKSKFMHIIHDEREPQRTSDHIQYFKRDFKPHIRDEV